MKNSWWAALAVASIVAGAIVFWPRPFWSHSELNKLRSLWIGSLPPPPPDPSNRVADDPRAAALGETLFFDARLSANGQVSCATCHQPDNAFQDGLPLGRGIGLSERRTPTLIGVAYSPWLFWDGRADSLWAQALAPLENPNEHGGDRLAYARAIAEDYRAEYDSLFGPLPDFDPAASWDSLPLEAQEAVTLVFVNIGKAIEAYERTLLPQATRFDAYVESVLNGDQAGGGNMSQDEIAGLKLFLGQANCVHCHAGPLFTDHEFHNTGVPPAEGQPPDVGWYAGLPLMLADEFGCKGKWSDAGPAGGCVDRRYLIEGLETQQGAFKTPTLRGAADRAPYMHAGQFATLDEVLRHYRIAPGAAVGQSELKSLALTDEEVRELIAFLGAVRVENGAADKSHR